MLNHFKILIKSKVVNTDFEYCLWGPFLHSRSLVLAFDLNGIIKKPSGLKILVFQYIYVSWAQTGAIQSVTVQMAAGNVNPERREEAAEIDSVEQS
jgi:hypothetical protein